MLFRSIVKVIARRLGAKTSDLPGNAALLDKIDAAALAGEGIGGLETIRDIISELRKPGRDPRTDNAGTAFRPAVEKFEDLRTGTKIPGIVTNITAFGAFVNLGIKDKRTASHLAARPAEGRRRLRRSSHRTADRSNSS